MQQTDLFSITPEQTFEHARFDGAGFDKNLDQARLSKQIYKIFELMKDGHFRTLAEIEREVKAPQPSVSANLRNLKKKRFGGHGLEKRRREPKDKGIWEYRIIVNKD